VTCSASSTSRRSQGTAPGTLETGSKQRKVDIVKRLKLVEAIKDSPNKAEWMIMDVIPVIPPDLRPLVLLESGNFRDQRPERPLPPRHQPNNRLKKLQDLHAPKSSSGTKSACSSSGRPPLRQRRTKRPVLGSSNRPLKSLTDMIKGKQGRFARTCSASASITPRVPSSSSARTQAHQCASQEDRS